MTTVSLVEDKQDYRHNYTNNIFQVIITGATHSMNVYTVIVWLCALESGTHIKYIGLSH